LFEYCLNIPDLIKEIVKIDEWHLHIASEENTKILIQIASINGP